MSSENSPSDIVLAERLKRENLEQFNTLVRMHLSFVLDLNTDDNEAVTETAKLKKWSLFKKSKFRGVMEGAPLTQEGICRVYQVIEYLSRESNICQEGIFRRTGSLNRQQELRTLLNAGTTLNLDSGTYSVHDCASVLKGFLAELPEPLLTNLHHPAHCQIAELCGELNPTNETRLLHSLQLLLLLLPVENRSLLKDVLELLHLTASYEHQNKMSADSLATLFTPHLLCPRKLTPEALHVISQTMTCIVSFMIKKGDILFEIPPKLATDVRAYFVDRENKKVLSPRADLNESVSDSAAANTVFSFVDHERTAQAYVENPTEAALAQLYAYIQAQPESTKKRKLIKQFNKQNGQGIPLQVQRSQKKDLKSKCLGNSLKKHIFQKTITKNAKKTNLLLTPISTATSNEDIQNNINSRLTTPKPQFDVNCVETQITIESSSPSLNMSKTEPNDSNQLKVSGLDLLEASNVDPEISKTNSSGENKENLLVNEENTHLKCVNDINELSNKTSLDVRFNNCSNDHLENIKNTYLTSTPAMQWRNNRTAISDILFTPHAIGRRSMSPITRSTRRMSKAMQESMMTPRSRKPVLLISGTNICNMASMKNHITDDSSNSTERLIDECPHMTATISASNKSSNSVLNRSDPIESIGKPLSVTSATDYLNPKKHNQSPSSISDDGYIDSNLDSEPDDDASFQEMSKDELSSEGSRLNELTDDKSFQEMSGDNLSSSNDSQSEDIITNQSNKVEEHSDSSNPYKTKVSESLSHTFQDYLQTRNVLTISPNSTSDNINDDLSDSKFSDSLLYCLDGNNPENSDLSAMKTPSNLKRNYSITNENGENSIHRDLTIKVRKVSETGDVVYETSL